MKDYEKKYKEALERAKKYKLKEDLIITQDLFPELKESEDERIRKEIISAIKEDWPGHKDWIAWLEAQGDKDKLIQELGEYKVKYTQEVLEKHLKTINKDDERLRKTTIAFLKDFAEQGYENAVECIDWLEKQGETSPVLSNSLNIGKVEQKPAWSEEDASLCTQIQGILSVCRCYNLLSPDLYKEMCDWLKALRPQSHWKPSDEQILAIKTAINVIGKGTLNGKQLVELQEQLKKLK